jgi:hypothetical protein
MIGKREPVSDRHTSHEGRFTPARACRGEDECRLARLSAPPCLVGPLCETMPTTRAMIDVLKPT